MGALKGPRELNFNVVSDGVELAEDLACSEKFPLKNIELTSGQLSVWQSRYEQATQSDGAPADVALLATFFNSLIALPPNEVEFYLKTILEPKYEQTAFVEWDQASFSFKIEVSTPINFCNYKVLIRGEDYVIDDFIIFKPKKRHTPLFAIDFKDIRFDQSFIELEDLQQYIYLIGLAAHFITQVLGEDTKEALQNFNNY